MGEAMRRREFVTFVSAAVVAWPLGLLAQQSGKILRIGFIAHRYEGFYAPLFDGLRELGYVEGRNLIFERRYAEGHADRFKEFAAEMVRLKVDLIIVVTTPAAFAARNATTTIPIVHPAAIDPVGTGLIASLAHPGGNVTGLSVLNAELSAKRLEVLKEVVPGLSRGALLWNAANPANSLAWKETEGAARALGVTLQSQEVRSPRDFEGAFATIAQQHPRMFVVKEWVEEGGLMSYGDRLPERYRRAADLVDRILKGAKPADLPVEQPTMFELAVNLKPARVMGLPLSPA